MAPSQSLPFLATCWFLFVTPIVCIDAIFVLNRASPDDADPTHPLHDVMPFSFWTTYADFDHRYAPNDDAFVVVQSYLNIVEVILGLMCVVLSMFRLGRAANQLAILVATMTFYKTVMYFAMDIVEGGKYTSHNSLEDTIMMFVLPSSLWLTAPAVIVHQCFVVLTGKATVARPATAIKKSR